MARDDRPSKDLTMADADSGKFIELTDAGNFVISDSPNGRRLTTDRTTVEATLGAAFFVTAFGFAAWAHYWPVIIIMGMLACAGVFVYLDVQFQAKRRAAALERDQRVIFDHELPEATVSQVTGRSGEKTPLVGYTDHYRYERELVKAIEAQVTTKELLEQFRGDYARMSDTSEDYRISQLEEILSKLEKSKKLQQSYVEKNVLVKPAIVDRIDDDIATYSGLMEEPSDHTDPAQQIR